MIHHSSTDSCQAKVCPVLHQALPPEPPLQQRRTEEFQNENVDHTAGRDDRHMQNDKFRRMWRSEVPKGTYVALLISPVGLVQSSREKRLHTHDTMTPPFTTATTQMTTLVSAGVAFPSHNT